MNCCVWAYFMGATYSMFGPVCYFFATLIFMGMMDLASQLSNPFGSDQVDFPVTEWLEDFLMNVNALVAYEQEGTGDDLVRELKRELRQNREWGFQVDRKQIDYFLNQGEALPQDAKKAEASARSPPVARLPAADADGSLRGYTPLTSS